VRVRTEIVGIGQHPNETVVQIMTIDGPEQLVVDQQCVQQQSLDIGFPVGQHDEHYLIELPRETFRGAWRVWVDRSMIVMDGEF